MNAVETRYKSAGTMVYLEEKKASIIKLFINVEENYHIWTSQTYHIYNILTLERTEKKNVVL